MSNPASDVWYSFVAVANTMVINVTGLNAPSLGLYEGSSCSSMLARGCDNGTGSLSLTIDGVNVGTTYFLQISGEDENDIGDMELEIVSTNICTSCLVASSLISTPVAVNNQYNPGETVEFCYTIDVWSTTSNNWLHSVVPTLGAGWDLSLIHI